MQHEQTKGSEKTYDSANDGNDFRRKNECGLLNGHSLAEEATCTWRGVEGISGARQVVGNTGSRTGDGTTTMGWADEGRRQEEGKQEGDTGSIDPLTLPYVMMSELRYLPTCSGIYFAIEEGGEVAYIGQSINIRQRWKGHHVQHALCDLASLDAARRVRLAWLVINDLRKLDQAEQAFIRRFNPRLNCTHKAEMNVSHTSPTPTQRDRRGKGDRRIAKWRSRYMERHRVLTAIALEMRAYKEARRLAQLRERHGKGKVFIEWIGKDGRLCSIQKPRGLEPGQFIKGQVLEPEGFLDQARRSILEKYNLVSELPDHQ